MRKTAIASGVILAASLFGFSASALAEPFYLIVPDGSASPPPVLGDADFQTATVYQFGIDFKATSTYTDSDGSYDGSDITTFVTVDDVVTDSGSGSISGLLDINGVEVTGNSNDESMGDNWQLSFVYTDLTGTVKLVDNTIPGFQGIGSLYTSGTIQVSYDVFDYNDLDADGDVTELLSSTRVMDLLVYASSGTIGNAVIYSYVDFSDAAIDQTLADNMFFFADGTDWYDLWLAGSNPGIEIYARIDTNVDPQLIPTCDDEECTTASRTNTLNGSVEFSRVPEPGSLVLLGAGLLGLGWSRRARKS